MANELSVAYEVDGTEITLSPAVVLSYLVDDQTMSQISNKEMAKVIMTCKARRLNPFTGDVFIQPRNDKKTGETRCSLVTSKDFFQRRANANPRYRGKAAGITVLSRDGRPVKRKGSAVYAELGEKLLGGWCEVHVEGRDEPEYAEVSLEEYSQGFALWKSKPATMIRKVAVSQALREAFPDEFNGLYEPEEMGVDTDKQDCESQAYEAAEEVAADDNEIFEEEF